MGLASKTHNFNQKPFRNTYLTLAIDYKHPCHKSYFLYLYHSTRYCIMQGGCVSKLGIQTHYN